MLDNFKDTTKSIFQGIVEFLGLILKELRSIRLNRNFLVFLVFLAISTFLWFIVTANETLTSDTIDFRVEMSNVPKDVIFTTKVPDTVKVKVRASGKNFFEYYFSYLFHHDEYKINLDYNEIDTTESSIFVSNKSLTSYIKKFIGDDFELVYCNPTQITSYFTRGKAKKIPIVFDGKITPGPLRVISNIDISPKYAEVYLPKELYNSIKEVHLSSRPLKDLVDPTTLRLAIKKIDKIKISPDSVDVKIDVDILTEKTMSSKIYYVNCPDDKLIRTFPEYVNVTFRTTASKLKTITPDSIAIAVDYNKINVGDRYCKVELIQKPDYVTNVRFSPQQVQFVMEQINQ